MCYFRKYSLRKIMLEVYAEVIEINKMNENK